MPRISGPEFNFNGTFEEDCSENDDLHKTLHNDVLPHVGGDQTFISGNGFSLEKFICWGLGGQGQ